MKWDHEPEWRWKFAVRAGKVYGGRRQNVKILNSQFSILNCGFLLSQAAWLRLFALRIEFGKLRIEN
jgi:hypothetical protein